MNFFSFKKEYKLLLFFSFLLFLFSCGKEDVSYTVNPELAPYLERFLQEGAKRGKILNVEEDGIIMEFADLKSPTIGLCHYTLPIRIQIDRTYWKETKESANRENLREDLVFHELAHGLLNRRHLNDTLPDNEWTSMMCGGDEVNGRSWAVNFNGYRKNYYLDELFNYPSTTPVPDWSELQRFDGECPAYLLKSEDYTFTGESKRTNGALTYQTGNGFWTISSSDTRNTLLSLYIGQIAGDFYLEINLSAFFAVEGAVGIFSGFSTILKESSNYFIVSSGPRSYALNTECMLPFAEVLITDKYKKGEENKLALAKKGEELFFYINDELVYRNDYETTNVNLFGVIVPAMGSVSIRNYALYASEQSMLRADLPEIDIPHLYRVSLPAINYLK